MPTTCRDGELQIRIWDFCHFIFKRTKTDWSSECLGVSLDKLGDTTELQNNPCVAEHNFTIMDELEDF